MATRLNYVKPSYVRKFINDKGMHVSKDYIVALDREVAVLMEKHVRIAQQDRRKTVMVVDIELPARIKSLSRELKR